MYMYIYHICDAFTFLGASILCVYIYIYMANSIFGNFPLHLITNYITVLKKKSVSISYLENSISHIICVTLQFEVGKIYKSYV